MIEMAEVIRETGGEKRNSYDTENSDESHSPDVISTSQVAGCGSR